MSRIDLQRENERLRRRLAEAHAAIADRDAKIEKLARDFATLEAHVKRLLAGRRGGHTVPDGQGLLFADHEQAVESDPDSEEDSEEDQGEGDDDGRADEPRRHPPNRGARRPRKIDTAGLPCEERVHELP